MRNGGEMKFNDDFKEREFIMDYYDKEDLRMQIREAKKDRMKWASDPKDNLHLAERLLIVAIAICLTGMIFAQIYIAGKCVGYKKGWAECYETVKR